MKKAILIISVILLIFEVADCQWYQKYYGVSDPGLLSQEQIDMALKKSKDGVTIGTTFSIIGAIGILTGVILYLKDYPDEKYPDQAEIGKKFEGVALALVSVPVEIIGFVVLKKNQLRVSEIEEFIKNSEIKIGFINYPAESVLTGSTGIYYPGFLITFRF